MPFIRSEEHTSELQSHDNLVCRLLLEKKQKSRKAPAAHRGPPSPHRPPRRAPPARPPRLSPAGAAPSRPPRCSRSRVFFFKERPPPKLSPLPRRPALPA